MNFLGVLQKNTIEPLVVYILDRLETLTDMSTVSNLRFSIKDSAGNIEVASGTPSTDGMKVICLIDTTGASWDADLVASGIQGDEYRLYITFVDGSATPLLLVGKFRVEDD